MNRILFLALLVSATFFASCGSTKKVVTGPTPGTTSGVKFIPSQTLTAVLERAEKENKLVFVDFYTTWCTPCKMMDKDVFSDKGIADFFNDNFLSYKVDAEKGNGVNLATVFDVSVYPTLFFLNEKGRVLEKKQGAAYHTELMEMARRALDSKNTLP